MKNKKYIKYIVVAIACICLICGGFFFFSQENKETEKDLTEIEKVIARDLKNNYPKTPREVVKFYNRIVKCYYGDEPTETQLKDLADQMRCIMDEDLLLVNTRDEYYESVRKDIAKYKDEKKKLVSTDVCDSNDVKYVTDDKGGEIEKDEIAFVDASYFLNMDGQFKYSYAQFVLREDEKGRWKILAFYKIKGEDFDDK